MEKIKVAKGKDKRQQIRQRGHVEVNAHGILVFNGDLTRLENIYYIDTHLKWIGINDYRLIKHLDPETLGKIENFIFDENHLVYENVKYVPDPIKYPNTKVCVKVSDLGFIKADQYLVRTEDVRSMNRRNTGGGDLVFADDVRYSIVLGRHFDTIFDFLYYGEDFKNLISGREAREISKFSSRDGHQIHY